MCEVGIILNKGEKALCELSLLAQMIVYARQ
jgi:hypothetical protein